MVRNCSIVGCHNRADDAVKRSWFQFPRVRGREGKTTEELTGERLRRWIAATNRKAMDGTDWVPSKHSLICSDHFVSGMF